MCTEDHRTLDAFSCETIPRTEHPHSQQKPAGLSNVVPDVDPQIHLSLLWNSPKWGTLTPTCQQMQAVGLFQTCGRFEKQRKYRGYTG